MGRLGWLVRLRWLAVIGSLLFIEVGRRILPIQVSLVPLYTVLGLLAAYNLLVWLVLRRAARDDTESTDIGRFARFLLPRTPPGLDYYDRGAGRAALLAVAQIVPDLCFLTVLLHFAGGIENPLRVFLVFHVIIASILLSRAATYAVATLGALLLTVMGLGEMWGLLQHYSLEGHWRSAAYTSPGLVGTQLFLLAVTLYVAAYLASSIAARLRRREVDVVVLSRHLADKARRVEDAYAELRVAERAKSQYMRKVAHELREPLGTVKTALTVALDSAGTMPERARDLVERAQRRAGELAEMTRELLALARAQGAAAVTERVPVDLSEIAQPVLEEMTARASERGLAFAAEVEQPLPHLSGDPEALTDLMTNLLGNAVRYTPPGGSVTFRVRVEGDTVVLEVHDTGIGIPEDDRIRIFDEFYRSPNARDFATQGSGLGMPIVKAVVEQHSGDIRLESRLGKGTLIRVRLPVGN
jgi:signal transduction histidine kinase